MGPLIAAVEIWTCGSNVISLEALPEGLMAVCPGGRWPISGGTLQVDLLVNPTRTQIETWSEQEHRIQINGKSVLAPPFGVPTSSAQFKGDWYVSTDRGVFRYSPSGWVVIPDPGKQPISRVHGMSLAGDQFIIGGLGGSYVGRPSSWRLLGSGNLQNTLTDANGTWFLEGSGSVCKFDPKTQILRTSALVGAVKRPSASSLGTCREATLFGLYGGWAEKDTKGTRERYPVQLKGEFVTAIAGGQDVRWIGTQVSGLWRFGNGITKNWNPANGLEDPWVTAIVPVRNGSWIGTYGSGLYLIEKDQLRSVACPTQKIRRMAVWEGNLIVGGLDGAWIRMKGQWHQLDTKCLETTGISVIGKSLWVMTPVASLRFAGSK